MARPAQVLLLLRDPKMNSFERTLLLNPGGIAIVALCTLATAFMIRFLVALVLDAREMRTKGVLRSESRTGPRKSAMPVRHLKPKTAGIILIETNHLAPDSLKVNKDRKYEATKRRLRLRLHRIRLSPWSSRPGATKNIFLLLFVLLASVTRLLAQAGDPITRRDETNQDVQQLKTLVQQLQTRVVQLEAQQQKAQTSPEPGSLPSNAALSQSSAVPQAISQDDRGVLDFLHDTTLNVTFDSYYGYNFNAPVGRVNLLRAYDVTSNTFSINQAAIILERTPDPSNGRRFGARVDLLYGQATETLQGSAVNELRPQAYRNLFQAYGTYVAPLGSGLTVDFGKWASALGPEGNYSKDQINYSRSYFFNFLPFYHMGFRAAYNVSPKLTVAYWLVNGANQTEDFNGFKSQNFEFVLKPNTSFTWTSNYYFGQESRDVVPILNPGFPTQPTQPGLPVANIGREPNGREHIFDNYFSWSVNKNLTLAGEFDYAINRQFEESTPAHVIGGAAYARYQLTSKVALATRAEYLSDRGGLFSGVTQALKEMTVTYEYKLGGGLCSRLEWRRDFSNQPFFLTDSPGMLKKEQNTATLGVIWCWGRKTGSW
jgi:Putative beta-barrel porin-2, OmpL-like. bbp2